MSTSNIGLTFSYIINIKIFLIKENFHMTYKITFSQKWSYDRRKRIRRNV